VSGRRKADSFVTQYEIIRDAGRIASLLDRLRAERLVLSAAVSGPPVYRTAVINANGSSEMLVVEELYPEHGNQELAAKGRVMLTLTFDGRRLDFSCELLGSEVDGGLRVHRLTFPDYIRQVQRRREYRFPVDVRQRRELVLKLAGGERLPAELVDLSESGAGVIVAAEAEGLLVVDHRYPVIMRLPQGTIETDVEVRFVGRMTVNRLTRVGIRFVDMSVREKAVLRHFILELKRLGREGVP
jgi:c-di-GMP-binding flagellar brake protein YcgR